MRDAAGGPALGHGPGLRHMHAHGEEHQQQHRRPRSFGMLPVPGGHYVPFPFDRPQSPPSPPRSPGPMSPLMPSSAERSPERDTRQFREQEQRERDMPGAPRFAPRVADIFRELAEQPQRGPEAHPMWFPSHPVPAPQGFAPMPMPPFRYDSHSPFFDVSASAPGLPHSLFANSPFANTAAAASAPRAASAAATAGTADEDRRQKIEEEDGIRIRPLSPEPVPTSPRIPVSPTGAVASWMTGPSMHPTIQRSKTTPGITKSTRFADEEAGLPALLSELNSNAALGRSSSVADLHAAAPRGFGPRMRRAGSTRSLNVVNADAGPSSERVLPLRLRLKERLIEMGFTDRPQHLVHYIAEAIEEQDRGDMTVEEYEEKLVTSVVERVLRANGHGSEEEVIMPGRW